MTAWTLPTRFDPRGVDRLPGLLFVLGGVFAGYGGYMHLTMGDRTLGNCVETGVCDPWHPQWVLAPLAVGGLCVLGAAVVAWTRRERSGGRTQ